MNYKMFKLLGLMGFFAATQSILALELPATRAKLSVDLSLSLLGEAYNKIFSDMQKEYEGYPYLLSAKRYLTPGLDLPDSMSGCSQEIKDNLEKVCIALGHLYEAAAEVEQPYEADQKLSAEENALCNALRLISIYAEVYIKSLEVYQAYLKLSRIDDPGIGCSLLRILTEARIVLAQVLAMKNDTVWSIKGADQTHLINLANQANRKKVQAVVDRLDSRR